jgi:hypothetical protein
MILPKLERSWITPWTLSLLVIFTFIGFLVYPPASVLADEPASAYNFVYSTEVNSWVMDTSPNYSVVGTSSTLTVLSSDGRIAGRWYTPSSITYEGSTAYYYDDGLKWVYTLQGQGVELSTEVYASRGDKDYEFTFLTLGENIDPFRIDSDGNAITADRPISSNGTSLYFDDWSIDDEDYTYEPQLVIGRGIITADNISPLEVSPWEIVDDYKIKFSFDDSNIDTYPYTITSGLNATLPGPIDFRIVDIRSEYGQLVVEVEHFDSYDNFTYYELYTWQGRQGNIHNIATNDEELLLLDDMTPAPLRTNSIGQYEQYLPAGREWTMETLPQLNADAITGVISMIHRQRGDSWLKGQQRLTLNPLGSTDKDHAGTEALLSVFSPLIGTSYTRDTYENIIEVDYDGLGGPREYPAIIRWGTTSTFTPSFFGYINNAVGSVSWDTMHDAVSGTAVVTATNANSQTYIKATTSSGEFNNTHRSVFLFDTSDIDAGDTVTAATFRFSAGYADADWTGEAVALVLSHPASDTTLVNADYSEFTFVDQAARLPYSSVTVSGSIENDMVLNATGLGNISKTGITKFGIVSSFDVDGSPTWVSNRDGWVRLDYSPAAQLVVTHSVPGRRRYYNYYIDWCYLGCR